MAAASDTLSAVGDVSVMTLAGQSPAGPDAAARWTLSGTYGAATVNLNRLELDYCPDNPPFIVGPGAVYGYWGGDIAVVGFAQLNFLVIPSALVSGLV